MPFCFTFQTAAEGLPFFYFKLFGNKGAVENAMKQKTCFLCMPTLKYSEGTFPSSILKHFCFFNSSIIHSVSREWCCAPTHHFAWPKWIWSVIKILICRLFWLKAQYIPPGSPCSPVCIQTSCRYSALITFLISYPMDLVKCRGF